MAVAKLALEDGTIFTGTAFGSTNDVGGEVVFNTSLTGYQEVLTDPSYKGQLVCMTYPLIGNYGITSEDDESAGPQATGFIVREATRIPSNYRSQSALSEYLARYNIPGIEGIDTRALVRRLRVGGAKRGVISSTELDDVALVRRARSLPSMAGQDLVSSVVPTRQSSWDKAGLAPLAKSMMSEPTPSGAGARVVALDYGMKWNIPRCLTEAGCEVIILPGTATAADVLALKPDGVFLSNGPGDPAAVGYAIQAVSDLAGKVPMFGICLGHQLLGLALGAKTFKLKFGHRGVNQPVFNKQTKRVEITSQNHGFAVDASGLQSGSEVTHISLNDDTLEGFRHEKLKLFGVQYHPESSAGPHDSSYLFHDFVRLMRLG